MAAIESPKNWFEDFGSGQLSAGRTSIALDPDFAQTVNTNERYHVYLTPRGDCKGLYVASTAAGGFEVRELGGGTSDVEFDYRIVALRRNYEQVRMLDKTEEFAKIREHARTLHAASDAETAKARSRPEPRSSAPVLTTAPAARPAKQQH